MDLEISLAIGATLMCLSIPSLVAAVMDRRFPTVALAVLAAGGGLILWVAVRAAGGLPSDPGEARHFIGTSLPDTVRAIPLAFVEVAGRIIDYFH